MTLVEMLERNAREIPQKTAIIFHGSKLGYGELNDTVNRTANVLLELGVKPGDRVGLMLPRIPELIISFLAVAKARGIAAPINSELPEQRIRSILDSILPRCLIVHTAFLDHLQGAVPEGVSTQIIAVGEGNGNGNHRCWNRLIAGGKTNNPGLDIKDEDIVYLNYTSGSTGNPKGAITTHANIYYNTIAAVDTLRLTPDDVHLCMFAPFAHPHEIFARPLYLGGSMVLVDKIYPRPLAEAIANHQVTCMMGLAPMYENLLGVLEHKSYDLSCLRVPESGGMYTRPELIERFSRMVGVPIIPVWGSTETTGIALANRPGEYMPPGSVGKPCMFYEARIVDERGTQVPTGEVGEMIFKGPAVVRGYYENGKTCLKDGWYYSGDLGRMDEAGNFYFVERKTGMMKVAGLKVYPLEIELVLMSHPHIKEAAVISAKDRLRGEIPKAVIVTNNGNGLSEKEVVEFCRQRLAHYKLPKIVEIRESLPKIGSGKINKNALQEECV
jgi:acyl-coenzyme A synthetase/AMP-(fatty) acid ligase